MARATPPTAALPQALQALDGVLPQALDPYLLWAWFTGFKGFGGRVPGPEDRLPFLVELRRRGQASALARETAADGQPLVHIGRSYLGGKPTRFCSVHVRLQDVGQLLRSPRVVRADMGVAGVGAAPGGGLSPLDLSANWHGNSGIPWDQETPVVGIIDHGIAMLNRKFRLDVTAADGAPAVFRRIVRFWDQWGGPGGATVAEPPWTRESSFGYGRLLEPARGPGGRFEYPGVSPARPEAEVYRRWRYRPVLGPAAHGTHVLDIAAGGPDPLRPPGQPASTDAVSTLPIVAVQLPWVPAKDVSGASLCVQVMDALRFIVESAGPRPVVVNLSDGAMAGSHNGASILERAIDEYLLDHPGVSVVVAAGNAFDKQAHAVGEVAPGRSATFAWRVLPDDRTDSFLEIWLDQPAQLSVALTAPGQHQPLFELARDWVGSWEQPARPGGAPETVAAGIHLRAVANGAGQMALLALRPTRQAVPGAGDAVAPHGRWTVSVSNRDKVPLRFKAWVERDDPPFGERGPLRQSTLAVLPQARSAGSTVKLDPRDTMNSLGTGQQPVTVGGYRRSDNRLADYSSAGGTGPSNGPTVIAPSEEAPGQPGLVASGNATGSVQRMNGTSVAAPVVTRMIANALVRRPVGSQPTASQVKAALRKVARRRHPVPLPGEPPGQEPDPLRVGSGWVEPGALVKLP